MKDRRLTFLWMLPLLLFLVLAANSPTYAQTNTSILKYDSSGRVIGVSEGEIGQRTSATDAALAARRGAAPSISHINTPPPKGEEYVAGEVLVMSSSDDFLERVEALGFSLIEQITFGSLGLEMLRLKVPSGVDVPQATITLRNRFPGTKVGANQLFEQSAGTGGKDRDPRDIVGWGRVPERCGAGIQIGMIDAAVDVNHPSLKGQKIKLRSFIDKGKAVGKTDHGTAIAAILVGKSLTAESGRLLPGAILYAGSIFEQRKDGKSRGNLIAFLKALEWLAVEKVQVVNLSIASPKNEVLQTAVRAVARTGQVLVAAAGNGGPKAKPFFPAAYTNVIAVTAVDSKLKAYQHANRGGYIDFSAPGVDLWTASNKGRGRFQSGTSFATPFITSIVSLYLEAGAKPNPDLLRESLKRYAVDLGQSGKDQTFGWGLVRARPKC